jgi:hypothetical protein
MELEHGIHRSAASISAASVQFFRHNNYRYVVITPVVRKDWSLALNAIVSDAEQALFAKPARSSQEKQRSGDGPFFRKMPRAINA